MDFSYVIFPLSTLEMVMILRLDFAVTISHFNMLGFSTTLTKPH